MQLSQLPFTPGPAEIGMVEGIMTLVQSVASPAWGVVADKTRKRKQVTLVWNTSKALDGTHTYMQMYAHHAARWVLDFGTDV